MTPVVGAVVVTHTNLALASACVQSLLPAVTREHLVVVLNAPAGVDDGELEALRNIATVVSPPVPVGYGENANLGVSLLPSDVDHVLISNDDVVFAADAPMLLSAVLSEHTDAAVVGPMITGPDGVPAPTCHAFPSVLSELVDHILLPRSLAGRFPRYPTPAPRGTQRVDWVLGAVLMVRRVAFDAVDGLEPRYVLYSEEIDLSRRLADRGWLTLSCGDAVVTHLGGASTGGSGVWRIGAESRNLYITRHWSRPQRGCLVALRWPGDVWNLLYTALQLLRDANHPRAKLRNVADRHRYMQVSWRWRHEGSS